jgi:hypothetical protein
VNGLPPRRTLLALIPLVAMLTAGCVNLPTNTAVTTVNNQGNTGSGSDVRIWPQEPKADDRPEAIVEGFLQTAASDPSNLSIAKDYLTGGALKTWDPAKVVVFSEESSVTEVPGFDDTYQIYGTEVASVSDTGVYLPVQNPQSIPYKFHLSYDKKTGYRIDSLPVSGDFGIALSQETFRADYTSYNLYFLNEDAPNDSMIPVPVYLRTQSSDAATAQALVDALAAGPPPWLDGAAGLAAQQVQLSGPGAVTIGPDDTALVSLKTPNSCTTHGTAGCNQLANELMATFSSLGSINRVAVVDAKGDQFGTSMLVDSVMRQYHIGAPTSKYPSFYYINAGNQHVYYWDGRVAPVDVQLGPADRKYAQLAVTRFRGATIAGVVDTAGSTLYIGTPGSSAAPVKVWNGQRVASLSWDALGHLWFLGTANGQTSVYRLDITNGFQSTPQYVGVYGTDGGTLEQISVAPDGRRIAAVFSEPGTTTTSSTDSLGIGVVDDAASELSLNMSYGISQPVVNQWTNIVDADWHGSQSLAVLGSPEPSSPLAVYELTPDGAPVVTSDYNAVTINPPRGATGIEWSGTTLLASYSTGQTGAAAEAIELYSFASSTWGVVSGVQGAVPSYSYWAQ